MRSGAGLLWLISATILGGCSTERYEGGFETSDLSARVMTPAGSPAVGARVWLVRAQGDTAPAIVLDSTRTDTAGLAKFSVDRDLSRAGLGLDGQLGHWLAISPRTVFHFDSTRIALAPVESVTIGGNPNGESPRLFVPGSHFMSSVSPNGRVVLALPKGTWTVAKSLAGVTSLVSQVLIDSAPVFLDTVPADTIPTPTDSVVRDTLVVGPDITRDSFSLDGKAFYLDRSFPALSAWTKISAVDRTYGCEFVPSLVSVVDSGSLKLGTRPKSSPNEGGDTNTAQAGAWVRSKTLPDTGTLALQFRLSNDPAHDSTLWRTLFLSDSFENGVKMMFSPAIYPTNRRLDSALVPRPRSQVASQAYPADSLALIRNEVWYFSWTPDSMAIFTSSSRFATVLPTGKFKGLQLDLKVFSLGNTGASSLLLDRARLYKPK